MGDAATLKKIRSAKKGTLTKRSDNLKLLLDQAASAGAIQDAFDSVKRGFEALEEAHEDYVVAVDETTIANEGEYLLLPRQNFSELRVRFYNFKEGAEKARTPQPPPSDDIAMKAAANKDDFVRHKAAITSSAAFFKDPCNRLDSMRNSGISFEDFRLELDKITAEHTRLKGLLDSLPYLDPSQNCTDVVGVFMKDVDTIYRDTLELSLEHLKEAPPRPTVSYSSHHGSSKASSNIVKRESVSIPQFSGKEPQAFLEYPVWRANWDKLIDIYPDEVRATVLYDHLDAAAKSRIVGLENDYALALEKLKTYYGNNLKVVQCCLKEIASIKPIKGPNDYAGLVAYSRTIDVNYKRLKKINEEKEISNTTVTNEIMQRLPHSVQDKYMDFFMDLPAASKKDPLPQLLGWLEEQSKRWEFQETAKSSTQGGKGILAHYGAVHGEDSEGKRTFHGDCYGCHKPGHMRQDCPGEKKGKIEGKPRHKLHWCAFHVDPPLNHHTVSCTKLRKLPAAERLVLLEKNKDCSICVGDHSKDKCKSTRVCGGEKQKSGCGSGHNIHELFCKDSKIIVNLAITPGSANLPREIALTTSVKRRVVLQVMRMMGIHKRDEISVIWDSCSTGRFVRNAYAEARKFKFRWEMLEVTGIAGESSTRNCKVFTCHFFDLDGMKYTFEAYGLESVTCTMGKLNMSVVKSLFPRLTQKELLLLQRRDEVDYLIGYENPSWHPDKEVRSSGGDFWLHRSRFGSCLGGSHPEIREDITLSAELFTVVKTFLTSTKSSNMSSQPPAIQFGLPRCKVPVKVLPSPEPVEKVSSAGSEVTLHSKMAPLSADKFFMLESLGTQVVLKCGGCQCSKCPIPGSRYSFKEQWQLDLIRKLLKHDPEKKCWVAEFPWIKPRSTLPDNYFPALKSLESTERKLSKIPGGGDVCMKQITDMMGRGHVVKLSPEEARAYSGTVHYIPHLLVHNPGSKTSPVRIVFDASRPFSKDGTSMNSCLAKGPDNYLNNLCGVLVSFRTLREAAKGDIRKFFNGVFLVIEDQHCQRFLWRNMETDREPDIYMVIVNNLGIRPSGTIATSALEMTAEMFRERYPEVVQELIDNSFVDDVGLQADTLPELEKKTQQADEILDMGGFKCKGWVLSHRPGAKVEFGSEVEESDLYDLIEKVLGMQWEPLLDQFRFFFRLNLGPKRGKVRLEPDITKVEFIRNPPIVLTRRLVLSIVAALFDPMSLLTPVLLQSKLLLRRSWGMDTEKLGWDDPLPADQLEEWIAFLMSLYDLEDITFGRSLTPPGPTVGQPWLILFSDGALVSFGACAYIRWELEDGTFWCRLIMSKGRIAPKHRATIPRMELSGATLSIRMEKFLLERLKLPFGKVLHLVDSSTVLGYLNKDNGSFKPYEGVRISEIQSNSRYVDGNLQDWAWISGGENPADLCTKPVKPKEIGPDSVWQKGPQFMYTEFAAWPVKTSFSKAALEGEVVHVAVSKVTLNTGNLSLDKFLARCSTLPKLLRVSARILRVGSAADEIGKGRSAVRGVRPSFTLCKAIPTAGELWYARQYWIRRAQEVILSDLQKSVARESSGKDPNKQVVTGKFKRLAPFCDEQGIWRVGSRMQSHVPFTKSNKPPALLPYSHKFTHLLMREAHCEGHGGQDLTLSKFRQNGYWTPQGGKLAKATRFNCVMCRVADSIPIEKPMGPIPADKLVNPSAWDKVELDLMGPFLCRGEKNPRTTVKVWGLVVVDQNSGAVHGDIVASYSASSVISAIRRFGSTRGWPAEVTSDPGSQLVSASGKLENWWTTFETSFQEFSGQKGFKWIISPANSPWRQGRAERRIGHLKRLLSLSLGDTKVTSSELQTCIMEGCSMMNDTPISLGPPRSDGSYPVITPHSLLLGRSKNSMPDDKELAESLPYKDRYRIVNQVTNTFWNKWATEVSPRFTIRQKWHAGNTRELKVGDLVRVVDKAAIKTKYRLAIVAAISASKDGVVRSADLRYYAPGTKKKFRGKEIIITRSIQRLCLILAVEEQDRPLQVIEDISEVVVSASEGSEMEPITID